jgi:hypothetical protein
MMSIAATQGPLSNPIANNSDTMREGWGKTSTAKIFVANAEGYAVPVVSGLLSIV